MAEIAPTCRCGTSMVKVRSKKANTIVLCDQCWKTVADFQYYWDCPDKYNDIHEMGYALCLTCGVNIPNYYYHPHKNKDKTKKQKKQENHDPKESRAPKCICGVEMTLSTSFKCYGHGTMCFQCKNISRMSLHLLIWHILGRGAVIPKIYIKKAREIARPRRGQFTAPLPRICRLALPVERFQFITSLWL